MAVPNVFVDANALVSESRGTSSFSLNERDFDSFTSNGPVK